MAKQLYDYWFVQFDFPNVEGKPYKSSGGAMNRSKELGYDIPINWSIEPLNRWLEIKSGFAFQSSTYSSTGKYKVLTIKNVQNHHLDTSTCDCIEDIPTGMKDWCELSVGDYLISLTGNCGRLCVVTEEKLLLNQRVGLLSCKDMLRSYAYMVLSSERMQAICQNLAKGAAQANLSPIDLCKTNDIVPPADVIKRFENAISPIIASYLQHEQEIIALTKQRDELLPLLMNGQVSVNYDLVYQNFLPHYVEWGSTAHRQKNTKRGGRVRSIYLRDRIFYLLGRFI